MTYIRFLSLGGSHLALKVSPALGGVFGQPIQLVRRIRLARLKGGKHAIEILARRKNMFTKPRLAFRIGYLRRFIPRLIERVSAHPAALALLVGPRPAIPKVRACAIYQTVQMLQRNALGIFVLRLEEFHVAPVPQTRSAWVSLEIENVIDRILVAVDLQRRPLNGK